MLRRPPRSSPFPYTTRFRSGGDRPCRMLLVGREVVLLAVDRPARGREEDLPDAPLAGGLGQVQAPQDVHLRVEARVDRKSTRLNSSHANISYAVFCLKKKTT